MTKTVEIKLYGVPLHVDVVASDLAAFAAGDYDIDAVRADEGTDLSELIDRAAPTHDSWVTIADLIAPEVVQSLVRED